jgi:hypothetical protein
MDIEELESRVKKNLVKKTVRITSKKKDGMVSYNEVRKLYDKLAKEFTPERILIQVLGIDKHHTLKPYLGTEFLDYDEYLQNRVHDTSKFTDKFFSADITVFQPR